MKRSLQSPSPLLKNQKKTIGSLLSPSATLPPFLASLTCGLATSWRLRLHDHSFSFSLYTHSRLQERIERGKGNETTNSHFSPHLFSFLSNPSPNIFFLARTRIFTLWPHQIGTRGFNLHHEFLFFCVKSKHTYRLMHAPYQWPSISLSHTLSSLNPLYLYYLSLIDFPSFLLICLFYFPVFFLEIYCINNLAVVCLARYNFSFLPFIDLIKIVYERHVFGLPFFFIGSN